MAPCFAPQDLDCPDPAHCPVVATLPPLRTTILPAGTTWCRGCRALRRAARRHGAGQLAGWPIATGVIEGACRHLVKDQSRTAWTSPQPAGASLAPKPYSDRSLHSNNDLDAYWNFHLDQERHPNHESHFPNPQPRHPASRMNASRKELHPTDFGASRQLQTAHQVIGPTIPSTCSGLPS